MSRDVIKIELDDGEAFLKKMMNGPNDNEEDKKGGATDASQESFPHSEVVFDNHEILPKGYCTRGYIFQSLGMMALTAKHHSTRRT